MSATLVPSRATRHAALLLALVTTLVIGCGQPASGPTPGRHNVLLIVIDTLRADHLGAYGYGRKTSPQIDVFAAGAVRYARAWSQAPWTTPSVASLLTGRQPVRFGITDVESTLPDDATLLSERLSEAGYRTGAIVSHRFVSSRWGFDQGFDHFDDSQALDHDAITSPAISERAIRFLDEHASDDFFLFLHYFDPHFAYREHDEHVFPSRWPYRGPVGPEVRFGELLRRQSSLNQADADELKRLYDSEIAFTDAHIGRVLAHLEALGLGDETMVILTADHGEEFLDHARLGHTKTLYDEVLRVPLLVRIPGTPAAVVESPVALLDVVPTVLAALGLPPAKEAEGRVLPLPGDASREPRVIVSATQRRAPKRAAIDDRYKLIRSADGDEIFDLIDDPRERTPILPAEVPSFESLDTALEALPMTPASEKRIEISDDERARLEALGYGVAEDE